MAGRMEFDFTFGPPGGTRRDEGDPLRVLVLGDFSGKPAAERPPLAERRPIRVDVDTLDTVMQRVGPSLQTAIGPLAFRRFEHFHPDHLFDSDLFRALRQSRENPVTGSDDVGRLLGKVPIGDARPATSSPATGLDAFIHEIVAPHVVKEASAETRGRIAGVEAAMTEQMRALLHAPAFQSLESAWRGIQWLISNLDLDGSLSVHLFDVTREELVVDLSSVNGAVSTSAVYRTLIEGWHAQSTRARVIVAGLLEFGRSNTDLGVLAAMGLIASRAGGPFFATGAQELVDEDGVDGSSWRALRGSVAGPWIGLAVPRVLLRRPYGRRTDPIESFAFEELAGEPGPGQLLWGHGSLAAALLIGQAFNESGWDMEPGDASEIADLPAYSFVRDGETVMQPCAERWLTENQIDAMLRAGLMPIASRRDRNAVVVVRFQSIADPPAPLRL